MYFQCFNIANNSPKYSQKYFQLYERFDRFYIEFNKKKLPAHSGTSYYILLRSVQTPQTYLVLENIVVLNS